jgi:predicted  nucleic acid-binding Zn-ribbon protein
MAENYVSLQADLEYYKKRSNSIEESYNNVCKSNNALRGHITRLKNKLNEKTKEIS